MEGVDAVVGLYSYTDYGLSPMCQWNGGTFPPSAESLPEVLPPTVRWTDSLPLILLGIGAALKQDLNCSTAELVYGTTLRVPGEFFTPACDKELEDPTSYVTQLRSTMRQLQPVPSRTRDSNVYIHDDLLSSSHVFIRHDGVHTSLQPPCDGPFKVVKRSEKFYTLDINGRKDTVSLDRLKPAYLEDAPEPNTFELSPSMPTHSNDTPPALTHSHNPPPAQHTTRFGCHVRWPK